MNSIGPRSEECALGGSFSTAMAAHLFYPLYPKEIVSIFLAKFLSFL
jgi:hypothetical protein